MEIKMRNEKILVCGLITLFMLLPVTSVLSTSDHISVERKNDACPNPMPGGPLPDPGEILFEYDVQSSSDDNQCLGVEFDGTYFYVTGGGGTTHPDPNKLHFFDADGNYIASIGQGTPSGWGWRDIGYDGDHFYSSDDNYVTEWYITGLPDDPELNVVGDFPGPQNPNRAIAYDPETDHFWTANFGSPIYEFDRDGNVINTYSNTYAIYGMAWDDVSEDGPWLWVYSQDGSPAVLVSQFDPINGEYTGVTYQGGSSGIAGGLCFTTEWEESMGILVGLSQGEPDFIWGMYICEAIPPANVSITDIKFRGLTISVELENDGGLDAENVTVSVNTTRVLLGMSKILGPETVTVPANETVRVDFRWFGFGHYNVTAVAEGKGVAEGLNEMSKDVWWFLIFGFVR
jgi:hypothetical protein